jgi:ribosomal protein S18 acetylase RimI-like enzyme
LLVAIGTKSFLESHGHSAHPRDIEQYRKEKYTDVSVEKELKDKSNIYHLIYRDSQAAGYSKIVFDSAHEGIKEKNVTELGRLYLLKEYYGLGLGSQLLRYNIELSRSNKQSGMWLFVWKQNKPAIDFYTKAGFRIIGSHDFKLSETHSNPNHHMFLEY